MTILEQLLGFLVSLKICNNSKCMSTIRDHSYRTFKTTVSETSGLVTYCPMGGLVDLKHQNVNRILLDFMETYPFLFYIPNIEA